VSEYVVIYEPAEGGGWGAYLPDLPGVVALGATRDEVAERIQEALTAYVDEIRAQGGSLPAAAHATGTAQG
jgi:predicted RNase H-like HicB family nuclease